MQLAQGVGAAVSGGIFGGPEGLIGGLGGLALGGVGGAFAGAAFGAQLGGLRQQLGGFTEYAAQIQKLEIALENTAGSQTEFNRAIKAASDVTKTLNVPQEVAISGMTRLSAAVKGAGGQISDAELVFKNVTAAIKGTGGSAQDVDGAITALVQVFSKGKVSAEELSGQLGERLPGAVTKFAEANEMTLPELAKALEQGQVGLDQLMKFIVELGDEYSGVAQKIAASSQDAGARLTVAFNSMRQSVGDALQPIGAEFQEAFADFIEKITPTLVEILPKIGDFALGLVKNFDLLAVSAGAAFAVFGVSQLAAIGGIGAALLNVAAAAGTATASLQALNTAAFLNPWTALAAGVAAVGVSLYSSWREQEKFNQILADAPLDEVSLKIEELEAEIATLTVTSRSGSDGMSLFGGSVGFASAKVAELNQQLAELKSRREELALYRSVGVTPRPGYAGPGFAAPAPRITPSDLPDPTGKDSGSGRAKKERESRLPQLLNELALQKQLLEINKKIRGADLQGNELLKIRLEGEKALAKIASDIAAVRLEKDTPEDEKQARELKLRNDADEARAQTAQRLALLNKQYIDEAINGSKELGKQFTEQISERQRLNELVFSGTREELALQYIQIEKIIDLERQRLRIREEQIEAELRSGQLKPESEKQAQSDLSDIRGRLAGLGGREAELKELAQRATPGKLQDFIEKAERALLDLEQVAINVAQGIGDAIGSSISNGLTGLIEGTATVKQIFADFLRDVGQILLQEGAKLIATYVAIGIARGFAGLRGNQGPALDEGITDLPTSVFSTSPFAAKGAYFAGGQADFVKPYAMGGIVTKPTFFKFADGGAVNTGVMGEAGPEAIMPLKRGLDGKLGVAARLDGALKRYRPVPGSAAAVAEGAELTTGSSAAGAAAIDVRYNVERINNVDYVTNQEFQAGLQQAASQGAERGQQLALRRLQQSVTTRRRLGI